MRSPPTHRADRTSAPGATGMSADYSTHPRAYSLLLCKVRRRHLLNFLRGHAAGSLEFTPELVVVLLLVIRNRLGTRVDLKEGELVVRIVVLEHVEAQAPRLSTAALGVGTSDLEEFFHALRHNLQVDHHAQMALRARGDPLRRHRSARERLHPRRRKRDSARAPGSGSQSESAAAVQRRERKAKQPPVHRSFRVGLLVSPGLRARALQRWSSRGLRESAAARGKRATKRPPMAGGPRLTASPA
mmetsp:Transcript_28195/g.90122  ORF Transcript_28195/g.90122 Transcript_28195/m.90122 type:complete len:244 (-) Transcript_28195:244-975(-)